MGHTWDDFLLAPVAPVVSQGWCLNNSVLQNVSSQPQSPFTHVLLHTFYFSASVQCPFTNGHFCFTSVERSSDLYSLDPVPILTGNSTRCNASVACTPSSSCIALQRGQQLVRITLLNLSDGTEEVVHWSGPREEIWEQGARHSGCKPIPCKHYIPVQFKSAHLSHAFHSYPASTCLTLLTSWSEFSLLIAWMTAHDDQGT